MQQVARGRIDMGGFSNNSVALLVPELSLIPMPFYYRNPTEVDCVLDSALTRPVTELLAAKGLQFLGWGEAGTLDLVGKKPHLQPPDLARALEDVGVAAIFVHGRTREQGFSGTVNLDGIRRVVQAVQRIPIIGNGDVTSPDAALKMLTDTGCAGVSIGRGAFYNPWIFHHTLHLLATGETLSEPTFEERIRVMCRHFDRMIEVFGEPLGCRMFRKVAPWYAKRFGPSHAFNKSVVRISSSAEFHQILDHYIVWRRQFLDDNGHLKPQYQPGPMIASFMQEAEPPVTQRESLPVPRGPVELW